MTSDPQTIGVYDARAHEYDALNVRPSENESLQAFIGALPEGARVLDLGCGPGHWAAQMVCEGLQVEATDASAEMVALASMKPGVPAEQATFDSLDAVQHYDGIWANFSLLHAPRADMPGHLARLHRALKPGGVLHIGLKLGDGEARDALGRFVTYYTQPDLTELLRTAGFALGWAQGGRDTGFDGTETDWICHHAYA